MIKGKSEKYDLVLLSLLSILLSIYLFFHTYVISLDGAFQYIPLAKNFFLGSLREGWEGSGQQPLYSFLIALFYHWIPNFEIAGKSVASFFGVLLVFPVYFLGRHIFDRKIAFFSTLLLCIHPYVRRFSADVLKESTYLFFLAIALWFSWKTIEGQKNIPTFSLLSSRCLPIWSDQMELRFFSLSSSTSFLLKHSILQQRSGR